MTPARAENNAQGPSHRGAPQKPIHKQAMLFSALVAGVALLGCQQSGSDSIREWTPADHHNQGAPVSGQVDTSQPRSGMPDLAKDGITDVVLATWKQNCIRCHGTIGMGDGPEARTFKPPNFTDSVWQEGVDDKGMALAIKEGKGKMPPFAHLPDSTVKGLIALIRRLNPDRSARPPASTGPDKAAGESATEPALAEEAKAPQDAKKSKKAAPPAGASASEKSATSARQNSGTSAPAAK